MESSDIPDHLPEDLEAEPEEPQAPYRSLWVPLLVIPAMIGMVVILISVLFGGIAGSEYGPQENLERMLHGGSNESDQAAMALVRQMWSNLEDVAAGEEPEWPIDETLLPKVRRGWDRIDEEDPDDALDAYVLAMVQAYLGDVDGVHHLLAQLGRLGAEHDPGGEHRFRILSSLGQLGPGLPASTRETVADAVVPFLESEDSGLRQIAAVSLQTLPSEGTIPALRGVLQDGLLQVRGSAAISLSHLGDVEAAGVLAELLDPESYAAERRLDDRLWYRQQDVSDSRIKAADALARLGRDEDFALLEGLAATDADLNVKGHAKKLLARR